jgi:DNA polymerase bacteriophage-type
MLERFEEQFGAPAGKALSRLIRPLITAPEGKAFVWGDWANIEARALPWLAKDEKRLDIFRAIDKDPANTPDVYIQAVAGMYDLDPYDLLKRRREGDKEVGKQRQKGKIAELALGFAGGAGALQSMAAGYGMSFEQQESEDIVSRWRASNKWAEEFWDDLMDAFTAAVDTPDGAMHPAGRVNVQGMFVGDQIWVVIYLPDGRPLFYRDVKDRVHITYDDFDPDLIVEKKRKLSFMSEKGIKWLWRGLLAENVTQAICASMLRVTLTRLDCPGLDFMPVVGHTHDEVITMCDVGNVDAAKTRLRECMMREEDWYDGIPMEVDIVSHAWYSKTIED